METKLANETMSSKVVTIGWTAQMKSAYDRMQKLRLRHLPVVNDSGQIVGMLSDRDVQRAMISEIKHEGRGPMSSESITFDPAALVRDYMGWPVLVVEQDTDLREVAERMLEGKISSLLVQDKGRTVGIVTTDDLMKVLIQLLGDPKTPVSLTLRDLLAKAAHAFDGVMV